MNQTTEWRVDMPEERPNLIEAKLNQGRKRLEELQDDVARRAARIQRGIERSQGRLRDQGLDRAYALGGTALQTVADVTGKVGLKKTGKALEREAKELEVARESISKPPIADYDELNVKQVIAELDALSVYELDKLAAYEKAHKDRKTVAREVERRLNR